MKTITKALLSTLFLVALFGVKVSTYNHKPVKKEFPTHSIDKAGLSTVNHLERRTFEINVNTYPFSNALGILNVSNYVLEVRISTIIKHFFSQTFPQREFHFYPFVAFW